MIDTKGNYCVMDEEGITLTESLMEATHRIVPTLWRTQDKKVVCELRDLDGFVVTQIQLPPEVLHLTEEEK